jgi:hypothetical protein
VPSAGYEAARQPIVGGQTAAVQRDAVVRAAAQQKVAGTDSKDAAFRKRKRRGFVDPVRSRGSLLYEQIQEWSYAGLDEDERGGRLDVRS